MMELSEELKQKLSKAKGDADFFKILAENGVDTEAYKKSLTENDLANINGGFENIDGITVTCKWCGEDRSDEMSYQFWASMNCKCSTYRCRSCGKYVRVIGRLCYRQEDPWD